MNIIENYTLSSKSWHQCDKIHY